MIRDHLGYLWSVAKEFKALLGGSSIVVVAAGLYEHYTQSTLHWIIYLWIVLLCGFIALFMSGVRSYRRLQPRLYINAVPILQEWQTVGHIPCRTMFFEIRNLSEATTVENVSVDLFRISPEVTRMNWLPVRLHVKHDNPMAGGQYVDHFSLNPKETKHIDLASLAESVLGNLVNGIKVEHVVNGANQHIPVANYDFTVVASGKDTPAITTVFKIRVKDGKLSYE